MRWWWWGEGGEEGRGLGERVLLFISVSDLRRFSLPIAPRSHFR